MKMKNYLLHILCLLPLAGLVSCGDPNIDITSIAYEPKIVVEGYLYPGEPVHNIKITRNFPLNQTLDTASFIIPNASVRINGVSLTFDPVTFSYYSDAIVVAKGQTYKLEVNAVVAGQNLQTSATTTVPAQGFRLLTKELGDTLHYGSEITLKFIPTATTNFYAFSIRPDSASVANFIFDNEFRKDIKPEDVEKDLNNYRFQLGFIMNLLPSATDTTLQPIQSFDTWFYSTYKVIVYAGDENFKNFVLTAPNVKEFDGNFHEPKLILTGNGIGVFASAIRDTAYFTINR